MDSVIVTGNLATVHDSEIDRVIGAFAGYLDEERGRQSSRRLLVRR
jgi:hypothetical protein